MKRLLFVLSTLVVACSLAVLPAPAAQAAPTDEKALERVEKELGELWDFVEASEAVIDEEFYPEFVQRIQQTQQEVNRSYEELGRTKETGDTKAAISRLREDIEQIQIALIAWREAAEAQDTPTFEEASYLLQEIINIYNEDVGAYNAAAHGTRYALEVLLYLGPLLLSLALSAALFGRALYYNHPSEDVIQEIRRQLRWHWFFAAVFVVVISIFPAYMYLFTSTAIPLWGWLLLTLALAPFLYLAFRSIQVRRLAKRHG